MIALGLRLLSLVGVVVLGWYIFRAGGAMLLTAMRYGWRCSLWEMFHILTHGLWGYDSQFAREVAAVPSSIWEGYGLAVVPAVLNIGSIHAARVARRVFPRLLEKAIAGDADALAVMSETLHAKVNSEWLASQDHEVLMWVFSKSTADWASGRVPS